MSWLEQLLKFSRRKRRTISRLCCCSYSHHRMRASASATVKNAECDTDTSMYAEWSCVRDKMFNLNIIEGGNNLISTFNCPGNFFGSCYDILVNA